MKKTVFLMVLLMGAAGVFAQDIQLVNGAWLHELRKDKQNDTLYVVNFWATWCKPCVEELPYFEQVNAAYRNKKVKVILVSNDMRKDLETRVKKFVKDKKLQSKVVFMAETNADRWINKVSTEWSGAIPATWFVRASDNFEHFKEGEMTYEEISQIINQVIK